MSDDMHELDLVVDGYRALRLTAYLGCRFRERMTALRLIIYFSISFCRIGLLSQ